MNDAPVAAGHEIDTLLAAGHAQRALRLAGVTPRPGDVAAAREFEGYLLRVLLDEMRRTVRAGGLFDGRATAGYQALLDDALTREAAARGGFGLADQMLEHWEARR